MIRAAVIPVEQLANARAMRNAPTVAEARLWHYLRGRQLDGFKFSRQVSIGSYIVDLVCRERCLIVEADGGQHNSEVDAERQQWLEAQGYAVLRFWNIDVLRNIEGVLRMIADGLRNSPPPSPLPEVGGGADGTPPPTSGRGLGGGATDAAAAE